MVDIDLPSFMDPVLEYLSSTLPSPVYAFVISLLAHCIALFTALLSLVGTLVQTSPFEWDAQTVLPPLISVLAAYLALITMYRTTSWIVRTGFWFVKWGTIFAALGAAGGWYMNGVNGGGAGNRSVMAALGGYVLDKLNGQGQAGATGSRSGRRSRSRNPTGSRPKAWESFDRHREWQGQDTQGPAGDAQTIMSEIVGSAAKVVKESGWWDVIKTTVDSLGPQADDGRPRTAGTHSKRKEGRKSGTRSR
ncbi:hypothetical protein HGRIS_002298 [Hohenbuehelia grisea]|uniref:Uncharacterized protein n=1 Tax=Hohenbuehelia grisea TaxID=104357 RepID=A0ABR3JL99_9AGAR